MTRKLASKAHSAKWSYESEGRERLRHGFPWLDRYLSQFENPLIQDIRFRLLLPFAEAREYQNDFLMHLTVFTQKERSIDPSYSGYLNRLIPFGFGTVEPAGNLPRFKSMTGHRVSACSVSGRDRRPDDSGN